MEFELKSGWRVRAMLTLLMVFCAGVCLQGKALAEYYPERRRFRKLIAEWKTLKNEAFEELLSNTDMLAKKLAAPTSNTWMLFAKVVRQRNCFKKRPVAVSRKLWKVVLKVRDNKLEKYRDNPQECARKLSEFYYGLRGPFAPFLVHLIDRKKLGKKIALGDIVERLLIPRYDADGEVLRVINLGIYESFEPNTMFRLHLLYSLAQRYGRNQSGGYNQDDLDMGEGLSVRVYNLTAHDCEDFLGQLEVLEYADVGAFKVEKDPKGYPAVGYIRRDLKTFCERRLAWTRNPKHSSNILQQELEKLSEANSTWELRSANTVDSTLRELNNRGLWRNEDDRRHLMNCAFFLGDARYEKAVPALCYLLRYMLEHMSEEERGKEEEDRAWEIGGLVTSISKIGALAIDPVLKLYEEGRLPRRYAAEILHDSLRPDILSAYLCSKRTGKNAKTMDPLLAAIAKRAAAAETAPGALSKPGSHRWPYYLIAFVLGAALSSCFFLLLKKHKT